jgi:hypothetical protein
MFVLPNENRKADEQHTVGTDRNDSFVQKIPPEPLDATRNMPYSQTFLTDRNTRLVLP